MVDISPEELDYKVHLVQRQTDYSESEIIQKLCEHNYDHIKVIKLYFGIAEKKAPSVGSVNQEIYKQMRHKLDDSMRDYELNRKKQ